MINKMMDKKRKKNNRLFKWRNPTKRKTKIIITKRKTIKEKPTNLNNNHQRNRKRKKYPRNKNKRRSRKHNLNPMMIMMHL